jgi:hypothetical protein
VATATSGRGGRTSTRRSFTDAIASSRASKTRAHRARRFRRHIPPSCTASFRMTFWSRPPRLTICIFSRLKSLVPEYVPFARKGCVHSKSLVPEYVTFARKGCVVYEYVTFARKGCMCNKRKPVRVLYCRAVDTGTGSRHYLTIMASG